MTRHKKFVKSEKNKTKLKGAKLSKGLNVTKTDFKVKKIVIRDQLKESALVEDGSIARSSIKDLLSKLQHHNASYRNEGIHYLKEILTRHPHEASKHLGAIIQGICHLAMDVEKSVRHECFKALDLVFSVQTADLIAPFFNVVTSYLRCAMTHINIAIQEDSLLLLDCLLKYTPSLIAQNSDSILSCFLDMISKSRSDAKLDRTLTVNLSRKSTSVKWRCRVLVRLAGILGAIVDGRDSSNEQTNLNNKFVNQPTDDAFNLPSANSSSPIDQHKDRLRFDVANGANCSLIRRTINQNCELPLLFRKSIDTVTINVSNLLDERDEGRKIRKYVEHLMTLLIETWMEVRPSVVNSANALDVSDMDGTLLSTEATLTLKHITAIVETLFKWMELYDSDMSNTDMVDWFRSKYCKEFVAQFLVAFPYHQKNEVAKGSKHGSSRQPIGQDGRNAGGSRCEQQNLSIAYVFWKLNRPTFGNDICMTKIIAFVQDLLIDIQKQTPEGVQTLAKMLRTILTGNARDWVCSQASIGDLLTAVIQMHQSGKFQKESRTQLLLLLCDVVLDQTLYSRYGSAVFENWLSTLPKMLSKPYISSHVLNTFSRLAKQQNRAFLQSLQTNQSDIIANLSHIHVIGIDDQMNGKQSIVNLFYWLATWDPTEQATLLNEESERAMLERLAQIKQLILQ